MDRIGKVKILIGLFLLGAPVSTALGGEIIGRSKMEASHVEFAAESGQPAGASLKLRRSFVSWQWQLPQDFQIDLGLGTQDLNQSLYWFEEKSSGLGLESFTVRAQTGIGWWRAGWLKVPFGLEGYLRENDWQLPASLSWNFRLTTARDMGLSYQARTGHFFSNLVAHNGEGDPSLDDVGFYTGQVGAIDEAGSGVLLSLQTGAAEPVATNGSTLPTNSWTFDLTKKLKIRQGALTLISRSRKSFFALEFLRAEVLQMDEKYPYSNSRLDISYKFTESTAVQLRAEELDFNAKLSRNSLKASSLGLSTCSQNCQSRIGLWLTDEFMEAASTHNRRAELSWRLGNEVGD